MDPSRLEGSSSLWRVDSFRMLLHIKGVVASFGTLSVLHFRRDHTLKDVCAVVFFLEEQRKLILLPFSSLFTNPAGSFYVLWILCKQTAWHKDRKKEVKRSACADSDGAKCHYQVKNRNYSKD